jgi:hypothetical protein
MAFRTPIPQFLDIDFMNNGEILNAANLNDRMLHKLDDKCEFLRSNLNVEVEASSRLAGLVGEDYRDSNLVPCWANSYNFGSTVNHHSAIEALDRAVSQIDASGTSDTVRLNNLDVYTGEPSASALNPSWLTPFAFPQSSNHHDAIQGLDDVASTHSSAISVLDSRADALDSQMTVRITEITSLQGDVGTLQSGQSTLDSQMDTAHSQLSILIPLTNVTHESRLDDLTSRMVVQESSTSLLNDSMIRVTSTINYLFSNIHSLAKPFP